MLLLLLHRFLCRSTRIRCKCTSIPSVLSLCPRLLLPGWCAGVLKQVRPHGVGTYYHELQPSAQNSSPGQESGIRRRGVRSSQELVESGFCTWAGNLGALTRDPLSINGYYARWKRTRIIASMAHHISTEDRDFLRQFESFSFEPGTFDHRSHVRLAYIYLCDHDVDTAHRKVRHALCGYLSHHDVDPSKYHETITQAWILAVRHFMVHTPCASSASEFIAANPALLDSSIMLTHYSKNVISSDKARETFVEPDRDPIPRHVEKND